MERYVAGVMMVAMTIILAIPAEAQDDMSTVNVTSEFQRSHGQKAVGTSTDVFMIAMPVATLAGVLFAKDWEGLKEGALTAAATAGATLILKYAVKEERPDHSNFHSFPSGHTATTFATAAFLQRRYGWKFGVPAYALAAYVGWGRVYSKKHHWWDVVAGAAIGAGSAYIFTKPWAAKHELNIGMTAFEDPCMRVAIPAISASMKF